CSHAHVKSRSERETASGNHSFTNSGPFDRLPFCPNPGTPSFRQAFRIQPSWSRSDRQESVLLLPAIDLRGGQCVRLRQGDYNQETGFGSDPAAMARRWVEQGASYLHLVDLDGAKQGRPINGESVRRIVAAVDVPCQLGGGLRTEADIAEALSWGVERVVIGTKALKEPAWFAAV